MLGKDIDNHVLAEIGILGGTETLCHERSTKIRNTVTFIL